MRGRKYCSRLDETCYTNLPLLTLISHWLQDNHDFYLDLNLGLMMYWGLLCLVALILLKIFLKIVRTLLKPLVFFVLILIVGYTKQFCYNENFFDFICNLITNIMAIATKIMETSFRLVFGDSKHV